MSFIYLASPYTDDDPEVVLSRYEATRAFTANALEEGFHVYSPIVHCHELAHYHSLPKDFEFWKSYNLAMLTAASHLWVLALEGWQESKGVQMEIITALELPIPMELKYYIPTEFFNDN